MTKYQPTTTTPRGRRWQRLLCLGGALTLMSAAGMAADLVKFSSGEVISESQFKAYLERRIDLKPLARTYTGAQSALEEMAMTRVLVLEGEKAKIERLTDDKTELFDDTYGHAVYKKLLKPCVELTDEAAIKKFYDTHPQVFTMPGNVRLARVILPVSEKIDGDGVMAWMMKQSTAMFEGKTTFAELAKRAEKIYKLDPQGDIGWVNLTGEVPVLKALAGAKTGDIVGPLREGEFGYLFLVGQKNEPRKLKWDEVKTQAAARALKFCRDQANDELKKQLFGRYGVKFDIAAVKDLFKTPATNGATATPAPAGQKRAASAPAAQKK